MLIQSVSQVVAAAEQDIQEEIESVGKLAKKASDQAYYKWNDSWTRSIQDVVRVEVNYHNGTSR
jgi:hypothetical protein